MATSVLSEAAIIQKNGPTIRTLSPIRTAWLRSDSPRPSSAAHRRLPVGRASTAVGQALLIVGPPPLDAELDPRHDQDAGEQEVRLGRGEPEAVVAERVLVGLERHRPGRLGRPAVGPNERRI